MSFEEGFIKGDNMRYLLCAVLAMFCTVFLCADHYEEPYQMERQASSSKELVKVTNDIKFGKILTDSDGRTLYIFTPDNVNKSNCYGGCIIEWPPLISNNERPRSPSSLRGQLSVTKRKDGKMQVTYEGMPLYYYRKDKKPGDTYGQGVDKEWYVINPDSGPILKDNGNSKS